jgi:hypothetical protein
MHSSHNPFNAQNAYLPTRALTVSALCGVIFVQHLRKWVPITVIYYNDVTNRPSIIKITDLFDVPYKMCIMHEDGLYVLENGLGCGSFSE